jgi:hypothetical protein
VETVARVEKSDALPPHPTSSRSLAHFYGRFLATALILGGFTDVNVEVSSSGKLRPSTSSQPFYATSAAPVRFCERFHNASPGYDCAFDAIYPNLLAI